MNIRFYGRRKGRALTNLRCELVLSGQNKYAVSADDFSSTTCLEIGAGYGDHIIQRALVEPQNIFIASDPFINGMAKLLSEIERMNIKNVRVFIDDVRKLDIPDGSIRDVYILFPDPWPKKRHHKRRIVNSDMIEYLLTKCYGTIYIATDHDDYAKWINDLLYNKYMYTYHTGAINEKPNDWPLTKYEKKSMYKVRHYWTVCNE